MNIPWKELLDFFMQMVEKCMAEGRDEASIRATLTDPSRRDWRVLKRALRREKGLYGKPLRDTLQNIKEEMVAEGPRGCSSIVDEIIEGAKGE